MSTSIGLICFSNNLNTKTVSGVERTSVSEGASDKVAEDADEDSESDPDSESDFDSSNERFWRISQALLTT